MGTAGVLRFIYGLAIIGTLVAWTALAVLGTVDVPATDRVIRTVAALAQAAVSPRPL
jgi:hypothetical protein